jgi:putative transposase
VSERRVCGVIGQPRATQRYQATEPDDEVGLTVAIIGYATRYGRYGYRRILALLRDDGWVVNHKRLEAAQAEEIVVNRWVLCASPALLAEPRLVL